MLLKIAKLLLLTFYFLSVGCLHAQDSSDIAVWKLKHELRDAVMLYNDFDRGINIFEQLSEIENSFSPGHWRLATVCYDKLGRINKSIELMKEMKSRGYSTFCHKDYSSLREYSATLQSNPEFCKLCEVYDYAINFPCEYSECRDSLVKYLILEGPMDKPQDVFVVMGYESYYDSLASFKSLPWADRLDYSCKKIDSLIRACGYPNKEKVVDPKVEFLTGLSIIHSGSLERYNYYIKNHSDDMPPQDFAYISDKIAVRTNTPQEYGTQIIEGKNGYELYPIKGDANEVDKKRMSKNLEPLANYLRSFGIVL